VKFNTEVFSVGCFLFLGVKKAKPTWNRQNLSGNGKGWGKYPDSVKKTVSQKGAAVNLKGGFYAKGSTEGVHKEITKEQLKKSV